MQLENQILDVCLQFKNNNRLINLKTKKTHEKDYFYWPFRISDS
jgi:hypothetical protein